MKPFISLGTFSADATGAWVQIPAGVATLFIGAADDDQATGRYDFGGGSVAIEISDAPLNAGARPLRVLGEPVIATAVDALNVTVSDCYMRAVLTGSTSPNLRILVGTGAAGRQ